MDEDRDREEQRAELGLHLLLRGEKRMFEHD
jgi:hypothetical protein